MNGHAQLEEKIAKLPKWAQELIADLGRRTRDAESRLQDYHNTQDESVVYVRHGLDERQYIQSDRVTFRLPKGEVTISHDRDGLYVNASYVSNRFVFSPHSSNAAYLDII